jgi:hypothetical protein
MVMVPSPEARASDAPPGVEPKGKCGTGFRGPARESYEPGAAEHRSEPCEDHAGVQEDERQPRVTHRAATGTPLEARKDPESDAHSELHSPADEQELYVRRH